jgi:1-deoxy-D-xylulose-5-phosphate synthase
MALLDQLNSSSDLKNLKAHQLPELAVELREYIVSVVAAEGGHLSASLGVVELTIALHFIFNTPDDRLVWDVGHQAYGHKILTGRKKAFLSNRKYKGISGFPKRKESPYDAFGAGHSSTSISAALGMAIASRLDGNTSRRHIAVIGDGALSGGMAYEALNQAGALKANLLVILNDNSISIDENVGALKDHLHALRENTALGNNLFESLGFHYEGPLDGHDLPLLCSTFLRLKSMNGPVVLHCITKKGKGYAPAESGNAVQWHAPGVFDPESGKVLKSNMASGDPLKYQEIFGITLVELAKKNNRIVGITPAMPSGSSMNLLMKAFPERAFDVDIAEQHAVTFAAGLAASGYLPFCHLYSTFLQRGYDQFIHDVALQQLPVVFMIDRAGLVGEDGATHHGVFDLAFLRCIPNVIIAAAGSGKELKNLMYTAQKTPLNGPLVIRYPRGKSEDKVENHVFESIELGKGEQLKSGKELAILSLGSTVALVTKAIQAREIRNANRIAHYHLRFAKPLDTVLLTEVFHHFDRVLIVEEGVLAGGVGSAVLEFMAKQKMQANIDRLGIPDRFIEHGSPDELLKECGLDVQSIQERIEKILNSTP